MSLHNDLDARFIVGGRLENEKEVGAERCGKKRSKCWRNNNKSCGE